LVPSIFTIENLTNNILQESVPLAYTPRNFVRHPSLPLFYVIESEYNVIAPATQEQQQNQPNLTNGDAAVLPAEDFGHPWGYHHWASCVQIVDPVTQKKVIHTFNFDVGEAAVSIAAVPFAAQDGNIYLVVGTGKNVIMSPRSHDGGFIYLFGLQEDGKQLHLLHKTKVEEPPMALLPFQGRVLAGVGTSLRLYEPGQKQLLRKAQGEVAPNIIVGLQAQGSRVVVSDLAESVIYVVYKPHDNRLIPFADDSISRWTTCSTMVDYETTAGGDKFGNLWLVRCPQKASEEADEEGSGAHLTHERAYLQGTPNRLACMLHFFPGDIPTSMQKCQLVAGGKEVLLWSGLHGTLGCLVPFESREDVDFFQSLEQHLRQEDAPLAGRDHLMYRSYYVPVKGVIDGDLCERFAQLPADKKASIAGELDRSVREVERKVADMRTRVAY